MCLKSPEDRGRSFKGFVRIEILKLLSSSVLQPAEYDVRKIK